MRRAVAAEEQAELAKKGLWSDAGMKQWKPPSDTQMLRTYANHRASFRTLASLVVSDSRLALLSRDPKSWSRAQAAGVSQEKIDRYVSILKSLDANETLAGVDGLGKTCVIVSDITFGLFDSGVIKGLRL